MLRAGSQRLCDVNAPVRLVERLGKQEWRNCPQHQETGQHPRDQGPATSSDQEGQGLLWTADFADIRARVTHVTRPQIIDVDARVRPITENLSHASPRCANASPAEDAAGGEVRDRLGGASRDQGRRVQRMRGRQAGSPRARRRGFLSSRAPLRYSARQVRRRSVRCRRARVDAVAVPSPPRRA